MRHVRLVARALTVATHPPGLRFFLSGATALKGRSGYFRDPAERGHLGSDQGFRLSASLNVSRRFPLSRAPYAPQEVAPTTLRLELLAEGERLPDASFKPSRASEVDGYKVELTGEVVSGASSHIEFHITRGGEAVEPDSYLGAAVISWRSEWGTSNTCMFIQWRARNRGRSPS